MSEKKLERLKVHLKSIGPCVVAFSGGRDSSFLLKIAIQVLEKDGVVAVTVNGTHIPAREVLMAKNTARRLGVRHVVVEFDAIRLKEFRRNGPLRCYWCKRKMFQRIKEVTGGKFSIVDGTTSDETEEFRPGIRAAEEAGVISPLKDAGLRRDDIREISRRKRFFFSQLVSTTCLASRIPQGEEITLERLKKIEKGENILHSFLGENILLRLRDHGKIARIEFDKNDIPRFTRMRIWTDAIKKLKSLGYRYVVVDMEGYRPARG